MGGRENWENEAETTHINTIPTPGIHIPFLIKLYPIRNARVCIREYTAVGERFGGGVDVELISRGSRVP
jgi:hypothetical protein